MTLIKLKLAAAVLVAIAALAGGGVAIQRAMAQSMAISTLQPSQPVAQNISITTPSGADVFGGKYRANWTAVTLNLTRANPAVVPDAGGFADSQTISIQGAITLDNPTKILGFVRGTNFEITRIIDNNGHDLSALASNDMPQRWYGPLPYRQQFDQSRQAWSGVLQPLQLYGQLNVVAPLPTRFALVSGYVNVLTCDRIEHVDVPYTTHAPATAVLPTSHLRFNVAEHNGDSYHYELVNDVNNNGNAFDGQVSDSNPLPQSAIVNLYLVDSSGQPMNPAVVHLSGSFPSDGTESGSGGIQGAVKIAAMRCDVAVGLHEQKMPVTLGNIDLPQIPLGAPTSSPAQP